MKIKSRRYAAAEILYIAMMIIPILVGIILKILFKPASEGITITGAQIYFTIPMPIQDLPITESQINSWLVIIAILGLCLFLTHGLKTRDISAKQHLAEWIVTKVDALVTDSMGNYFSGYSAFIAAILALSGFSSLLSLFGLYPPTSDINIVAGWAILVFALITYYKLKSGPLKYLKSFTEPVAFLTPLNVIGEFATPISMAFRHYGNILSGTVISTLIAAGLQGLSKIILGWIPFFLGEFPLFQIGLPAVLSVYFDVFSGCLQAYIFAMLTMMYIADGFSLEDYLARKEKKKLKKS